MKHSTTISIGSPTQRRIASRPSTTTTAAVSIPSGGLTSVIPDSSG